MTAHKSVPHEQAMELLPWLINSTLDIDERDAVLDHTQSCVMCRREIRELEKLRDSIDRLSSSETIPVADMRNINARIDRLIDRQNFGRRLLALVGEFIASPWRVILAAQTVLLVVLGSALLWPQAHDAEFTTLTQQQDLANGYYVRVVFSPELAYTDRDALLGNLDLAIVSGPSERGVYTLAPQDLFNVEARYAALTALLKNGDVLFAQPVDQGAGQ